MHRTVVYALLLAGCAPRPAPASKPCLPRHVSSAPALTGSYCVGTTHRFLLDETRGEPFTYDSADNRGISLTLHYPIVSGSQAEPAPYGDRETWGLTFGGLLTVGMHSQAVLSEQVADSEGGFPLILYSPGFEFGLSDTNTFMLHDLVSHGYVVAALDHPYVSLAVRRDDGRVLRFGEQRRAVAMPEDVVAEDDVYAFPVVVEDLIFALDQVAVLTRQDPLLHAGVDLTRVAAMGHSYGGAAAAELVRRGVVSAAIDYDGRFHADVLAHGIGGPLLLVSVPGRITADPPPNDNYGYREALATATPGYYAEVAKSVHGSFQADIPLLATREASRPTEATLNPEAALTLFETINRVYFDVALRGANERLLEHLGRRDRSEVLFSPSAN